MDQASGRTPETPDAVTSDQPRPVKQSELRSLLAEAASGCGGRLNSVMVILGDKLGIYKTGQYSSDTEDDSRGKLQHACADPVTHNPTGHTCHLDSALLTPPMLGRSPHAVMHHVSAVHLPDEAG
jgi:hypothetical protein